MKTLIIDSGIPNLRNLLEKQSQYLVHIQGTIPSWLNTNTILDPYHILNLYQNNNPQAQIMIIDKINKAIPKTIHIEEYLTLYPFLIPVSKRKYDKDIVQELVFKLKQRNFDVTLDEPTQVQAVFIIDPADKWEQKCQILCDLATTHDGRIGQSLKASDIQIPYYWSAQTNLLQMAFGVCYNLLYQSQPKNQILINDLLVSYAELSNNGIRYMGPVDINHPQIENVIIDQ